MKEQLAAAGLKIVEALLPLVTMGIIALIGVAIRALKAHTTNQNIRDFMDRLQLLSATVVQEVEQTIVKTLPGNPTADDYKKAKDAAITSLKSHLGPRGLIEARKLLGWDEESLDKNLSSLIESYVHNVKS